MLTRENAKVSIQRIIRSSNPVKTGIKLPIRRNQTFDVYDIPLEYLVPNVLNDRIAWKIREFESSEKRKLSFDSEEDIEYVYKLIEEENPSENRTTVRDLAENGQVVDGIITNKGIIIDGNRRATLLRKLFKGEAKKYNKSVEDFRNFKAIVLNENIPDNEIMALETQIQIGEDEKVGYNPINIYIKIDNLLRANYNYAQIANFMKKNETEIKNKSEIFTLMNYYLESINKENHYTLLSGLEDHFINSEKIFRKLDNKTYKAEWNYSDKDVSDFKMICFDYMRAKFEGKKYRSILLGRPNKTDGVFLKEELWKDFFRNHEEIINNSTLKNESDWIQLTNKIDGNLNRTNKLLKSTLEEKDINSLIDVIDQKTQQLIDFINSVDELSISNVQTIKRIEKKLYNIRKDFK